MRNQPNPQNLQADKRFDVLVKKQQREHEHLILSHQKDMQLLRDNLSLAMERFESLFEKMELELRDFKTYSTCAIGTLKSKIAFHEITIEEQKNTIQDLHKQMLAFQEVYATQLSLDRFKKEMNDLIKEIVTGNTNGFQSCQREFKESFNALIDKLIKWAGDIEKKVSEMADKSESNFSVVRVEKEGITKELTNNKKDVFIIQKKIENIYTLIERINKTGGICHKQE